MEKHEKLIEDVVGKKLKTLRKMLLKKLKTLRRCYGSND